MDIFQNVEVNIFETDILKKSIKKLTIYKDSNCDKNNYKSDNFFNLISVPILQNFELSFYRHLDALIQKYLIALHGVVLTDKVLPKRPLTMFEMIQNW